jgi:hypothetical protein
MYKKDKNIDLIIPPLKISRLIKKLNKKITNIDQKFLIKDNFFLKFVENKKIKLKKNKLGIILRFGNKIKLDPNLVVIISKSIIKVFGEDLIQDDRGNKIVFVYDRDRNLSINSGGRYHQTREGGSIHTDNVNLSKRWDYLLLGCIASGEVGGDSILVSGEKIFKILNTQYKDALRILKQDFFWERRGIDESFYKSPVITINKNQEPEFRYLRPYMISAHDKMKKPMNSKQLYALDTLDALLENPDNQIRFKLMPGDILITRDSQVLHGRTSFSDFLKSRDIFEKKNKFLPYKRTMVRAWIKDT